MRPGMLLSGSSGILSLSWTWRISEWSGVKQQKSMTSSMEVHPRKHHKRSTSSIPVAPLDKESHPASVTVPDNRNWMSQNRRSTSARRAAVDTPEAESAVFTQEMGLLLLSAAQSLHISGEDPGKARRYALKAVECLEKTGGEGSFVTSLQLLAATLCKLGQYEEAIQVLQKSVPVSLSNHDLVHASFSGFMQLGDTYFMMGQYDAAMSSYELGLQCQKQFLGGSDLQVAETCRYAAEAYLQLMLFKEAEDTCSQALKIHGERSSEEEVSARRVMALIHSAKGENEASLQQLLLATVSLSSLSLSPTAARPSSPSWSNVEVAYLDVNIGDAYLALGRYDEALLSYQKALAAFKLVYGEVDTAVASVYINLADVYLKRLMIKEAKLHCEKALLIYGDKSLINSVEEIAVGLAGVAGLFESMGEQKHAISLLHKAHEILGSSSLEEEYQTTVILGGVEAQMGVLLQISGNHEEAYVMLRSAISKYRSVGQKAGSSVAVGMLLNQLGLACVGLNAIREAVDIFDESRRIFHRLFGVDHHETLDVCVNLAGAYDAIGRVDDAINLLETVVEAKESKLGTAHPDVEHVRQWLGEMLKEMGRKQSKKTHTLHELLRLSKADDVENIMKTTIVAAPALPPSKQHDKPSSSNRHLCMRL